MKKFKVCLAVLMIAMMMGGSVWALDAKDHVKVAPNGKGDLLIFPWYFAMPGGYDTKITVINTSNEYNVVAKVIYRSYSWSVELLDHMIYLSPNDVWTGRLTSKDGIPTLVSTDDSILGRYVSGLATADDFANMPGNDVKQPLHSPSEYGCPATDSNSFGYIEVIEAAAIPTAAGVKVAKKDIYNAYALIKPADLLPPSAYSPANVLTGYQENFIVFSATLKRAVVFADYKNTFKLNVGANTKLGKDANNSLAEVEAAMGKHSVALPYVSRANGDMSMHIFNFPTKLSLEGSAACSAGGYKPYYASPYWNLVVSQCETYTRNTYDLMENTPGGGQIFSPITTNTTTMCEEVHLNFTDYSAAAAAYTEGWVRYNWGKSADEKYGSTQSGVPISFTGTPVLPSVLYWTDSKANWAEADAAYTNGVVKVNGVQLNYYHYSH